MSQNLRLLIVDDDKDLLRQLEFLLEDDFHPIYLASSRADVLNIPLAGIDVCLIDIRLSKEDASNREGLEAAKEVRDKNRDAVIILMSRYQSKSVEHLTIKHTAADAFIRKPFKMLEFIDLVKDIKRQKDDRSISH